MMLLQELVQLTLRDAGFDSRVGELFVDLHNAVHPAKVHQYPVVDRDFGTVSPILARADRVNRNPEPVRDMDALLDFVPVSRSNHGADSTLCREGGGTGFAKRLRVGNDVGIA